MSPSTMPLTAEEIEKIRNGDNPGLCCDCLADNMKWLATLDAMTAERDEALARCASLEEDRTELQQIVQGFMDCALGEAHADYPSTRERADMFLGKVHFGGGNYTQQKGIPLP